MNQGGANTTPGSPASGTAGTDSVAGTYGTLDLEANGSYTYTASSNITNLDVDDETFTDVFTYTVSDGNGGTDTATITITIEASGDVTARNDTGTVNEDGTLTVSNGGNVTSITSASFVDDGANDPFEIHTQDGSPVGIRFNNDGTKLFMVGEAGRDINEYAYSLISRPASPTINSFVPSLLNLIPTGDPSWVWISNGSLAPSSTNDADVILVTLPPLETVSVPSSLTVPVSLRAVTSPEASIVIVIVAVSVPPFPSETV